MKKTQNILKTLGIISIATTPVVAVVSCSSSSFANKGYDFGVAVPPISSLNYIKYKDLFRLAPTLVQGLTQEGPGAALKNQLQISQQAFGALAAPTKSDDAGAALNFSGLSGRGIYTLSDYGTFAGNIKTGNQGMAYLAGANGRGTSLLAFSLNGVQKFKGPNSQYNRTIEAKDYLDTAKYILDFNVGSVELVPFQEYKITGSEDFITAQKNYSQKFGVSYKNPWGKLANNQEVKILPTNTWEDFMVDEEIKIGNGWESQNPNDEEYVVAIKTAALKFLLEGFRISQNSIFTNDQENDFSKTDFYLQFENQSLPPTTLLLQLVRNFMPINKQFVDSIGGIDQFGTSFNKWQYSSPFDITDIRLGQGGYIDLKKDINWPTAQYTISNKVKIYFNDDPNVLSAMFEDKYISATDIPAIYQSKFWADPDSRQFMSKRQGYGTQALQFNLDKNTNGDSPLQNENFRNAIAHAIDRGRLLKLLNWDSSFPITTWTPLGSTVTSADGRSIDDFLSTETLTGPHRQEPYSLTASTWEDHSGRYYKFENTNREDNRFNLDEARAYYDDYVKETNDHGKNTLVFLSADPTNTNAALGIQSMLKTAFGDKIKIDVKTVPVNTYETLRTTGQFDLTTFNFDQYGSSVDSYIKHLITMVDEIDPSINKLDGFIDNPSGSWTLYNWYQDHQDQLATYEKYFNIPESGMQRDIWNKVIDIIKQNPQSENKTNNLDLIDDFNKIIMMEDEVINTDETLFKWVAYIEKIIALSSPIVPLLDVDNQWMIYRLYGIQGTFQYSLQYAYDVLNKPNPALPGKDALINER